ncbi:hypothetical protein TNIN_121901 [Trichonephila inaurata madagascariensis]|uniref:Uncharacterized protein n=1 Tax=Trichonephila inaurata madagascariensis TaxID=2747483 RepID=A0A8X7BQL2_9ARAC|nr:hypothetical protein TNIN_121901 [Trichonephila inaurata madagascariensis]
MISNKSAVSNEIRKSSRKRMEAKKKKKRSRGKKALPSEIPTWRKDKGSFITNPGRIYEKGILRSTHLFSSFDYLAAFTPKKAFSSYGMHFLSVLQNAPYQASLFSHFPLVAEIIPLPFHSEASADKLPSMFSIGDVLIDE